MTKETLDAPDISITGFRISFNKNESAEEKMNCIHEILTENFFVRCIQMTCDQKFLDEIGVEKTNNPESIFKEDFDIYKDFIPQNANCIFEKNDRVFFVKIKEKKFKNWDIAIDSITSND